MTLQIEEGKYYRTRGGRKVGPMVRNTRGWYQESHPWREDHGYRTFKDDGSFGVEDKCVEDLIAEWTDEPETGTLAELNLKPKDVVRAHRNPRGDLVKGGGVWTIKRIDGPRHYGVNGDWGVKRDGVQLATSYIWRIVSRASPPETPKLLKDMTDAEIGALVRAYSEGKDIQCHQRPSGEWRTIMDPQWEADEAYRIRPEPVRKTVRLYSADGLAWSSLKATNAVWCQTFDLIDGKPDCASIRMGALDD